MKSILTKNQKKNFVKYFVKDGQEYEITAKVRYDDECGNGHNTFSITGEIWRSKNNKRIRHDCESCGCIHEDIEKHFPELREFIKWHLVSSDEPLHYLANTLYLAGDRDCNGLKKGEKRQIKNGKTGQLCWVLDGDSHLEKYVDSDTCPDTTITLKYKPWYRVGEGKEREIESAKSSCVWGVAPDDSKHTFEDMSEEELKKYLVERLPHVQMAFKKAVESLGFIF